MTFWTNHKTKLLGTASTVVAALLEVKEIA